jgi:hypothetical protein
LKAKENIKKSIKNQLKNQKIPVKVANLYCNQEPMAMATNLYYYCCSVGQETHPF